MGLFQQVTDDGFPGAKSVDFIGQLIVYVEPMGRYWGWSALADALSYNALDVAQAESSPDGIVGLKVSNNEVLIFGKRTIEPWAFAPTDTATFQLRAGSVIESGCAAEASIQRLDNTVYYLTNHGQIARLNGYTPQIISTMAIEADIRECDWSKAYAFTFEDKGHAVYYINFPDGHSWGYDVRQNKWHRRESYGYDRWRINTLVKSNGDYFAGDAYTNKLYRLQWGYVYEGCEIMPRKFRTGVLHNDGNRMQVHGFRLFTATGGASVAPETGGFGITGSAPDAYVGDSVNFQYESTGGYPGQGVISATGEPPGSSVSPAGFLLGTYTTAGSYTIELSADDGCGNTATHSDTVVIYETILPPQLSGWKYQEFAADHATDYSDPDYDDSLWSTGAAPFGSWEAGYDAGDVAVGAPSGLTLANAYDSRFATAFATNWTNNTRLWLRRTFTLATVPAAGLQVTSFMDDNYLLYVNGDLLVTSASGLSGGGGATFEIPSSSLVVGTNVIAIRCDDEAPAGSVSVVYADFLIEVIP